MLLQALVCARKLSECSEEMAEALVKGDIHLILFSLLYREEGGEGGSAVTSPEHGPESTDGNDEDESGCELHTCMCHIVVHACTCTCIIIICMYFS